jgi:hypothetical protein
MSEIRSISQLLIDLKADISGERVSVAMILDALHERGFGVVMFFFAIPIALPFPVPPGINILFAAPLLVLAAQMMVGRHSIWMPKSIQSKSLSRKALDKTIDLCVPWLCKIEYLIKPRLGFMTRGIASRVVGFLGIVMALSIYVPIPLTNTVPGMGMCAMAIGLVMRDGLSVAVGALVGTGWVIMMALAIILLGAQAVDIIKDTIKGVL